MKLILQITSGKGPAECCWVVAQVLKIMVEEAKSMSVSSIILNLEVGSESNTLHSATLQLEGSRVNEFKNHWIGTILWIGNSMYRKHHKRKNWYIAVNELTSSNEVPNISEKDIYYQAIRSGGPGGQHTNKVSTAIRATHVPSRTSVLASDSRSQLQNKKLAKERLLSLLKIDQVNQMKMKVKNNWKKHNSLVRGNPIKVFEEYEFKIRNNI